MSSSAIPRRILVATDLSGSADHALRQADTHARSTEGLLAVCHVLPSSRIHMLFSQEHARDTEPERTLDERAARLVGRSVSAATGRSPASFEVFVQHGIEYDEIIRCAEEWRATRIVLGSHGQPSAMKGVLGGVVEKVVRYAHCPVLVARPMAHHGLVVAATDLSAPSLPAVEAAVDEAQLRGAALVILHVIDRGVPLGSVARSLGVSPLVLSPEMLHDVRETARAKIHAVLAKLGAQAEVIFVEGGAAPTILTYVEDRRPELVVVGTRGWTGLSRVVLGGVAEHVVRESPTSVLAVRLCP